MSASDDVLDDRVVTLTTIDGARVPARVVVTTAAHDERVSVEVTCELGRFDGAGPDGATALDECRRSLEASGLIIGVVGAERNATSSRMSRQMSRGMRVYRTEIGRAADPASLADTFAPSDAAVTLADQRAWESRWRRSMTSLGRILARGTRRRRR